jgi:SAM-dependent methyltransferase
LDFGCGRGALGRALAKGNVRCIGIDIAASEIWRTPSPRLSFLRAADLSPINAAPVFDRVVANHVLEHVEEPQLLLDELARRTKSSGLVYIVTPLADSLQFAAFRRNWVLLSPPEHLHIFSLKALSILFERAGLEVVRARPVFRDFPLDLFVSTWMKLRPSSSASSLAVPMFWLRHLGIVMQIAKVDPHWRSTIEVVGGLRRATLS